MGLSSYKSKPEEAIRLGIAACAAAGIQLDVDRQVMALCCRYSSGGAAPDYDAADAFVALCTAILYAEGACWAATAGDPHLREREGAHLGAQQRLGSLEAASSALLIGGEIEGAARSASSPIAHSRWTCSGLLRAHGQAALTPLGNCEPQHFSRMQSASVTSATVSVHLAATSTVEDGERVRRYHDAAHQTRRPYLPMIGWL